MSPQSGVPKGDTVSASEGHGDLCGQEKDPSFGSSFFLLLLQELAHRGTMCSSLDSEETPGLCRNLGGAGCTCRQD